ncbi:NAD(P)/FAD-dependent oxidoreductase [Ralstonia solanacearum]|uniref:Sarcosine oxidase (Beta subunit) protein n=1 Tax=Ralstonia solanacearum (strain Po82) TaxID=1031711 RepID=F6GAP5_RALS8|nr:FAD-binding oxidoreductase [Ralstonia solanacearum]AEG71963.1 sarcosine oxidase (beta subunit) protein [Ralstonia solanacearum Po82]AMP71811.1 sarcosine oxidase subunit beta [Ralstonia solanacearum]AMP76251.1 sarcosine oxidase subunit beta [Ralstonia solanacearum]AYB63223.1 sarcosine oxidase subunit beta [Ralstonia solanacearum]MBB6588947.1 FAD-binding oxidoreductase [Ralstonia solanacearum]
MSSAATTAATTTTHDTDVLVLGGGLMGTTTAFFLRQHGLSVTLLERELVGRQASGTNFGNVRRQGRALHQMPLANRARAIWGRVKALLGEDLEFVPYGHLRVCYTEAQAAVLEQHARDVKPLGLDLELFTAEQLRQRWGIFAPGVVAGSYSPQDGHANPRLAGPAFARAARRAGAHIVEHAEVTQVERDANGFVAHTADGRRFRAPQLLVACGAWSNRMAEQFGEPVPLEARGPQMGVTEPLPYAIGPSIGLSSPIEYEGLYFRQIARGNIVFGGGLKGPAHADRIRAYVKPDNVLRQLRELRRFVPAFEHVQLIRVWSGIEGYTADWQPVMGSSAKVPGLHYAFGFNGEGFAISPGVGETMAELIATGRTSIALEPYAIGRFAQAPVLRETV